MESYQIEDMEITLDCAGRDDWGKFSFPVRYGLHEKVRWKGYEFDFNLRGGLKRLAGNRSVWPAPQEVLKRTDGNDFIYYGTDGYESSYNLIKNYYVPFNGRDDCDIFSEKPLQDRHVEEALQAFDSLVREAGRLAPSVAGDRPGDFLRRVAAQGRPALAGDGQTLHRIIGGNLPVLPPDAIDVDYEVIPLIITEGCSYNCLFCRFKTAGSFQRRTRENIAVQIKNLKDFYGADIVNYNSLVLGQNDALAAGDGLLAEAAEMAYAGFNLSASYHRGRPNLFIFGTVDSFLAASDFQLDRLDGLPYHAAINVGLESPDQETLNMLGKPLRAEKVKAAFRKMHQVNRRWSNITVTCNFVLGRGLPPRHVEEIKTLLSEKFHSQGKGVVYLSPLLGASHRRQILREFREVKINSSLPVFIYLAQRL
jgi:hypothetical protein